uniref:Endosome-associated-trafficking regulator 1 n=1 Tax=Laticauda laticaudata TaxID=8630 RepID=A0A8C5RTK7_LATLA
KAVASARPGIGNLKQEEPFGPIFHRKENTGSHKTPLTSIMKITLHISFFYLYGPLGSCLLLDESSFLAKSLGLNEDLQEPFFADPTALDSLLQDDEDDWSGSYQPSAVEEAHFVRASSVSLSSSPLDSFYCNVSDLQTSPEQPGRNDHSSWLISCSRKQGRAQGVDSFLLSTRIRHLERTLEKSKWKEEKEARELEAMVQQVEENLQLMTVGSQLLIISASLLNMKVQMESYKSENKALKSGHLENLTAVKQNADVALQNLLAVITRSKQLISGAEDLQLVVDLLKSIDKISEIPSQGTP